MGRTISYKNLTGGLNVENSIGTINQSNRRTESPDMVNVEYYGLGGIKTMEGNIQFGNKLSNSIVGGWDYVKGKNRYMVIVTSNGEVREYKPISQTFELIYQFPSHTDKASFVNMNNGVVISNGVDDLLFYEHGRKRLLSGSLTGSIDDTNISGTSTIFATQLNVGDYIEITGVEGKFKVDTINSDTSMVISPALTTDIANATFYLSDISECNARLTNEDDPNINEPIRGLALNFYQGRLFVGTDDGIFYSELGRYNAFDIKYGGGVIRNIYNDTSPIIALGLYSSYMIIHSDLASYILDGNSKEPEFWEINPYSQITCKSQQSFTVYNRTYFVFDTSNSGIYPLTQQTIFNDKYVGDIVSHRINDMFADIRTYDADNIFVCRLPKRRQVIFYMPFRGETSSNIGIIYDLHTKSWLRRKVPQNVTIAFEYNDDVYIGTDDGKIFREFYTQTFDGKPIVAYWKSPWFDFGDTGHYKSFKEMAVYLSQEFTSNFKLAVRRDINEDARTRHITSEIYDADTLVWDDGVSDNTNLTYWDLNEWAKTGLVIKRFPVEKQFFYNYQLEFYTEETATEQQGFCLYGFDLRDIKYEETPF